jgi:hypothetical protein
MQLVGERQRPPCRPSRGSQLAARIACRCSGRTMGVLGPLVRCASQRAPTRTVRCARRYKSVAAVCRMPYVHARPAVTAGPPCAGRPGRRGRRLSPVVWRMTQSRQAGVDCSGRAHVNFASNRASVGSSPATDPCQVLAIPPFVGVTDLFPATLRLNHSTTQPRNHATTQPSNIYRPLHTRLWSTCLGWPHPQRPTAATCTSTIAIATHCANPPSVPLQSQPQPQSGRLHHVSHRAVLASHTPRKVCVT